MFPVAGRRLAHLFLENPAEIQGIVVTHHRADLLDRIVGAFQQHPCPVEPDGGDILHRRHPHCQPETANEPAVLRSRDGEHPVDPAASDDQRMDVIFDFNI